MKVIKRNGSEVEFDPEKIKRAITLANNSVLDSEKISDKAIDYITAGVVEELRILNRTVTVEEIQDIVERRTTLDGSYAVGKSYIKYRYDREKARTSNTTDDRILAIIETASEEIKQENSNKNPTILSTQRDYMAGETSKDISRRKLLPQDIVQAHDDGIIHFHDMDYFAQHSHNCCLVNLDDMLQNGTVISGTLIEKPHSFSTACNIATQIIAQVASSQYGGQSISLAHLAPFVDESRKKYRRDYAHLLNVMSLRKYDDFIESLVRKDIEKGVQIIQYQVITLMTTNGQAPFITVFMDINEVPEGQTRDDLALIIEEVLTQRIQGVKNESGVWITPAFPKLIYALDENNIKPGTEYFYLTELSAKCTAKRMVPDYISRKLMNELKGDVYTCMGCRSFLTPDRFTDAGVTNIAKAKNYVEGKHKYYGRLTA